MLVPDYIAAKIARKHGMEAAAVEIENAALVMSRMDDINKAVQNAHAAHIRLCDEAELRREAVQKECLHSLVDPHDKDKGIFLCAVCQKMILPTAKDVERSEEPYKPTT